MALPGPAGEAYNAPQTLLLDLGGPLRDREEQPCISPGSLNRIPASAGGKDGNVTSEFPYIAEWQIRIRTAISVYFTLQERKGRKRTKWEKRGRIIPLTSIRGSSTATTFRVR